ncbi:TPA: serine acetyltransferase [Acinetobacter baumannii]|uniref:serine O-acetyltransferase EpsC n=1 Tax=Acinetobacter baumannii TaxID=470 RepID=UPI001CB87591|nr:serine O-acetyltransferase EpsC [Acinetobacter baumannii]EKU5222291.1 serine acetyltransferase [Acinetobacter baumannii]EKU6960682.1 serine acetyltransferase [Acinetobacter baumannii]EKV1067118.1 serine acetyltransferase [Acinetobacter baumannii]EKV1109130.1 serine acetyltransferase [Acinetobacter baumannii]EKV1143749.1 serine acetyltransferase [Acinetobacter baumannii]
MNQGKLVTQWNINAVVQGLQQARHDWRQQQHRTKEFGGRELPSKEALKAILDDLCGILFPMRLGPADLRQETEDSYIAYTLNRVLTALHAQVQLALNFANTLPSIRRLLDGDVRAAYEGDPAAHSVDEVLLCYPGIFAIIYHRIAHQLYAQVPLLSRIISELAHSATGIDIHPGAQIGKGFFIDHGTGVVIGETCVIGERVRIYQAVTLGAKRFETNDDGGLKKDYIRHPIVEDDVVIYAGATILGRITIGRGSIIGGNVWLTHSVAASSQILQSPNESYQKNHIAG